jgi:hypothetical protein
MDHLKIGSPDNNIGWYSGTLGHKVRVGESIGNRSRKAVKYFLSTDLGPTKTAKRPWSAAVVSAAAASGSSVAAGRGSSVGLMLISLSGLRMSSTSPFLEVHTVEFAVILASLLLRRVADVKEGGGATDRVASGTCSAWRTLTRKAAVLVLAALRSLLG